jgi:hypothetical protein
MLLWRRSPTPGAEMRRWGTWLIGAMFLGILVLSAPILWIEVGCKSPRDPAARPRPALVNDGGYARPESNSYLTYPQWHTVYTYGELAVVLRNGDPSDFAYFEPISEFWSSFCELHRLVTTRRRPALSTKIRLYAIGWSFTADMAIKGAYENTIGRFWEWYRGPDKTEEERFATRDMVAYAAFLRQAPGYEYPFGSQVVAFWRETPLRGSRLVRKLERRVVLTSEYATKAIYANLIEFAAGTSPSTADQTIQTIVTGLEASDVTRESGIKIVRRLGAGRTLIQTPRYQAYTDIVVKLARRGRDIVEIAGNHRILVTVLAPDAPLPTLPQTIEMFEMEIPSKPDRRRVALDVPVEHLATAIRTLEKAGVSIEHIYDY